MKKTWGELKGEIIRLGGESEDIFGSRSAVFYDAVNRAMGVIACFVKPCVGRFDHTLLAGGEHTISPQTLVNTAQSREVFGGLTGDRPVVYKGTLQAPAYEMTPDGRLIFDADVTGEISIYYKILPAKIGPTTGDSTEIPLDYDAATLLPLLAAFYVWVDADERKAVLLRNDYEELKAELLRQEKELARARVVRSGKAGEYFG